MKIREPIIATPSFVLKIFPWSESVDLIKHNLNVLWHRNGSNQIIILMNQHNTSVKIYRTKKLNNGSRVTGSAI